VIFDNTAVVNLLATANATSEIRAGELPCEENTCESDKLIFLKLTVLHVVW